MATFSFDADFGKADKSFEEFARKVDTLDGRELNFDVDTAEVSKKIARIEKSLPSFDVPIDIDTGSAEAAIRSLSGAVPSLDVPVSVDSGRVRDALGRFAKSVPDVEIPVDANTAPARDALGRFIKGGGKTPIDVPIHLQTDGAQSQLSGIASTVGKSFNFEAIGKAGEFLTGIEEFASETIDAQKRLAVQTGLTGDALEGLKDKAVDLFKDGVGASVAEATSAIGTAKQQLGAFLSDAGLTDFTKTAAGIGKVYDKDVNEVIAKSRTFISNFKLDGKEAGNLLALAFQKAGTGMDDILDTTDEYSQLLSEAGFSAEQFIGILTTGVQAGVRDTDKLADALKETQIRLKAGDISNSLKDISSPITAQIQQIVKAGEQGQLTVAEVIQKTAKLTDDAFQSGQISDSIRNQLNVAISGTPAEDIGANLYGRIFGAPIDSAQITAQATTAGEQLGEAIEPKGVFAKIGKSIEAIKTKAATALAPFVSGAGSLLTSVSQVAPGLSIMTDKLGGIGKIGEKVKGLFSGGGGLFGAVPPQALIVVGVIAAVVAGFVLLYNHSTRFREAVDKLVAKLKEFGDRIYQKIKPALDTLGEILGGIARFLVDTVVFAFETLVEIISTVVDVVSDLLTPAQDLGSTMTSMAGGVKTAGEEISGVASFFKSLAYGVTAATGAVKAFIRGIGDLVKAILDFRLSDAWSIFTALISGDIAEQGATQAITQRLKDDTFTAIREQVEQFVAIVNDGSKTIEERKKALADATIIVQTGAGTAPVFDKPKWLELADMIAKAQAQLDKIVNPPKKPGNTGPSPVEKETESVANLTSALQQFATATRQASDAQKVLEESNPFTKQRLQIQQQTTNQLSELNRALADAEAQFRKLKDKAKFEIEIEPGKTIRGAEALKILQARAKEARDAVEAFSRSQIAEIDRQQVEATVAKGLETWKKTLADTLSGYDAALKQITGLDDAAFQRRLDLELQKLRDTQTQTEREFALGNEAFATLFNDLVTTAAADGVLAADEIETAFRTALDTVTATNADFASRLQALRLSFVVDTDALKDQLTQAREDLLASLGDDRSVKLQQDLLALRRAMEKELQIVGDNEEAKAKIRARYLDKERKLREEFLLETDPFVAAAKRLSDELDALFSAEAFRARDAQREQTEQRLREIDRERSEIQRKRRRGEVDAREASARLVEIDRQRAELSQQLEASRLGFFSVANQVIAVAAEEANHKLVENLTKNIGSAKNAGEALTSSLETAAGSMLLVFSQFAIEGENIYKSLVRAAFDAAIQFLNAMIPIWLGASVGQEVAKTGVNPITLALALASAGVARAILESFKQQALASFDVGGYTGDFARDKIVGHVHGKEFVFNAATTARYRPAFDLIHQGARGQDIARAFLAIDQNGKLVRQGDGALVQEVAEMRKEIRSLNSKLGRMADRYESHNRHEFGEARLRLEHDAVSGSLRVSNRLRRATG